MIRSANLAREYLARGWRVVPIPVQKKRPHIKGWTELAISAATVDEYFDRDPLNIGVLLGAVSGNLIDVDLDCDEACVAAGFFLPSTNAIFGRISRPASHYLFGTEPDVDSIRYKDPESGDTLAEIRSTGCQTVFPGSVHPSGEHVDWYEEGPIADVSADEILLAVRRVAAAALLAKHWPTEGGRHDACLTLTAVLIRAGWTASDTAHLVEAVSQAAGAAPQLNKRLATAKDTVKRLQENRLLRGWPSFLELFGQKIGQQVAQWLDLTLVSRTASVDQKRTTHESLHAPPTLRIGSDVEIARRVREDLEVEHGDIVFCEGRIWYYDGTCWRAKSDNDVRLLVQSYDGAEYPTAGRNPALVRLGAQRINSALRELSALCCNDEFFAIATKGINCASGFISFDRQGNPSLQPHDLEHRARHMLKGHWPLDATLECAEKSLLSKLLSGCFMGDDDADQKINLVAEVAAAAALGIATSLVQPRALVLYGRTAENGKSQILDLLRGLFPSDAVAALPLHRFSDDKYLVQLAGRSLNACDELAPARTIGSEGFKLVITGEPVTARDVYRPAFQFRCGAQHVFATNHLPDFHGGMDRGVRRRLRVLSFERSIPKHERIAGIGQKICDEEADFVLDFFVEGASRLLQQGKFTEPPSSKRVERDWLVSSDPVIAWFEDEALVDTTAPPIPVQAAYQAFRDWARAQGYADSILPAVNTFSQRVTALDAALSSRRQGRGKAAFFGLRLAGGTTWQGGRQQRV